MNAILIRSLKAIALSSGTAYMLMCIGCASANIDVLARPKTQLIQPDYVLVYDCAVSAKEVDLDHGFIATAIRDSDNTNPSEQELKIGHAVAQALSDGIVENLRLVGIRAGKASDGYKPNPSTLVIFGKFVKIDQGNQAVRVLIGFGFGNGDIQVLLECAQGGRSIAKAMVTTSGSLKPGLAVPVAGGAAAGTLVVSSIASGAATGISETFMATLEADAHRAAKEIAKKIVQGYINRGWAKPEAMDKLNSFF